MRLFRLSTLSLLALVSIPSADARSYRYGQAPNYEVVAQGSVYLTNQTSAALSITVDGVSIVLGAGRSQIVQARAGDVYVRATYRQFGETRVLSARTVYVRPGRSSGVVLSDPTTGLVKVENDSDRAADLVVDGRVVTVFGAHQTRIVSVSLGRHDLAMVAGAWTIDRTVLDVRAFREPVFISEMPRANDLVVVNPLPIAVQLSTDSGMSQVVEARGQAVFAQVPLGSFHVSARRLTGERIGDIYATIRPEARTSAQVDAPALGLVAIHNDAPMGVSLLVDGRRVRTLGSEQDARIELAPGGHHIEAIDERGRRILESWVTVDRYATSQILIPSAREHRDHDDRQSHNGRGEDDRSDAERAYGTEYAGRGEPRGR
jgi:hypothetical protein